MKKVLGSDSPSRASLREMPEVDLKDGKWRRNPYVARIAVESPSPKFSRHGALSK